MVRSRSNPLTDVLTVRFSPRVKERLEERAIDEDVTLGEVVRRAVDHYLKETAP